MWRGGYKPSTSSSEPEDREAKRKRLEAERAERLQRAQQRANRQKQLQAAIKSQEEADQALKEFLEIDPDIFTDDSEIEILSAEEESRLLAEDIDIMAESFEVENGTDGDKAVEKLGTLQCPFSKDIRFWFSQLETQLEIIGVKSQWVKRLALQRILPIEIQEDVKSLLMLSKANAGTDIYLKLKTELVDLFGEKPEDGYIRAKNRVMTGKPSQLGKALINDLCRCSVKLNTECCSTMIWAMFREKLPLVVRNHIAEMKFDKTSFKKIFEKADQIYDSNQGGEPSNPPTVSVAAATTAEPEVAAVSFKNKNQNRPQKNKNQGGGQQNKNQGQNQAQNGGNKPQNQRQRHPTAKGDSDKLCKIHFKFGVNANFCVSPWKCPMKDQLATPQN